MTSKNLAMVFAPNLLRSKEDELTTMITDSPHAQSLMKTLIDEYHYFFEDDQSSSHGEEVDEDVDEAVAEAVEEIRPTSTGSSDIKHDLNVSPEKQNREMNKLPPPPLPNMEETKINEPPSLPSSGNVQKEKPLTESMTTSSTKTPSIYSKINQEIENETGLMRTSSLPSSAYSKLKKRTPPPLPPRSPKNYKPLSPSSTVSETKVSNELKSVEEQKPEQPQNIPRSPPLPQRLYPKIKQEIENEMGLKRTISLPSSAYSGLKIRTPPPLPPRPSKNNKSLPSIPTISETKASNESLNKEENQKSKPPPIVKRPPPPLPNRPPPEDSVLRSFIATILESSELPKKEENQISGGS